MLILKSSKCLTEPTDAVAVPIIAIRQVLQLQGVESRDLRCQSTKFVIAAILSFVSTSNFISIHTPSVYKLSMIRFVHKVHFNIDFLITQRLYALFT